MYGLERELSNRGKARIASNLQKSRVDRGAHFLLDGDGEELKASKTKFVLERVQKADPVVLNRFGAKYGRDLIPSVVEYLRSLDLDNVVIDDDIRQKCEDWWEGWDD